MSECCEGQPCYCLDRDDDNGLVLAYFQGAETARTFRALANNPYPPISPLHRSFERGFREGAEAMTKLLEDQESQ